MTGKGWRIGSLIACFSLGWSLLAAADEAPFVPSSTNVVDAMLSLAGVGSADYVVDLGSGDGRIPIAAARRFGAKALGIEYDPSLVAQSRARATQEGVASSVEFRQQDIFEADFSQASVVTMYLLPEVNLALRPRLLYELRPGTRVVSHDFDMGEWQPERSVTVPVPDKTVGTKKESTIYLWVVPARLAGYWRGTLASPQGEERALVEFRQEFQKVQVALWTPHLSLSGTGRIDGEAVTVRTAAAASMAPLSFALKAAQGRIEGEAQDRGQRYVLKLSRITD